MTSSAANTDPWWRDPRGLASAATIVVMILGFFYVREKQMWEQNAAIRTNEQRGATAILEYRTQYEKLALRMNELEKQFWELDHRIEKEEKRGNRRDEKEATPPY